MLLKEQDIKKSMLDREQFGSKHQTVLLKKKERCKTIKWNKTSTIVSLSITIEAISND